MSILDQLINTLAPHECLGCDAEEGLLCRACNAGLIAVAEQCYRCRQASPTSLTCLMCHEVSMLYRAQAAAVYTGLAKDLVWKLKFTGAQAAAGLMAKKMAPFIKNKSIDTVIVPVPTATSRVRQRGYDQADLLARSVAKQAKIPYTDCLIRSGQTHQRGSSRRQRRNQLTTAFRVRRTHTVSNARVILIDDVMTTGATLEAAASALRAAGAKQVEALVFAQS